MFSYAQHSIAYKGRRLEQYAMLFSYAEHSIAYKGQLYEPSAHRKTTLAFFPCMLCYAVHRIMKYNR